MAGFTYALDKMGNRISKTQTVLNPLVESSNYDSVDQLVRARYGTACNMRGVETTQAYDARNRVIRRSVDGEALNLTYDGWNLIEERSSSGELRQAYVHGAAVDEILAKITPAGAVYYHADGLGSVVALTDETGAVVESYSYDAFGRMQTYDATGAPLTTSAYGNRFTFTGREFLGEVGLYDYRNRIYSPTLGRFLQTDPIRFAAGDVNLYRYVFNSPINWSDPFGLVNWWQVGRGGLGIAGAVGAAFLVPLVAPVAAVGLGMAAGVGLGLGIANVVSGLIEGPPNIPSGIGSLSGYLGDRLADPSLSPCDSGLGQAIGSGADLLLNGGRAYGQWSHGQGLPGLVRAAINK